MILHPEAVREFRNAAVFYDIQEPGLGVRFVDAIQSGFRQIQRGPSTWRSLRGNLRRFLVKTFPYGIVYAATDEGIFVVAIMHLKREPDYWLGRLKDLPARD